MNWRRLIIERLGGEWYEYDWYDEDEWDDEDEYLTEWSLKVRQTIPTPILKNITDPATKISWIEDELFPRLQLNPDVWFDGVWVE